MSLLALHAKRRQLLAAIRSAEMALQYELAAHLLVEFQEVNQLVRNVEEIGYHEMDVRHDQAIQASEQINQLVP